MNQHNPENEHWKVLVLLLKEVAEQKNLTQQQVADTVGITQSNLSRLFAVKYKPNLDLFLRVANAVGLHVYLDNKKQKKPII
jgi:transcriptional regulator with XRE-family HTH domain